MKQRPSLHKKHRTKAARKATFAAPALTDLPPRDIKRWLGRHKAIVVAAVQNGVISLQDARIRYCLSVEELLSWEHAMAEFGVRGLSTPQGHRRSKR